MIDLINIKAHISHIQHVLKYVSPQKHWDFAKEFNKNTCDMYIHYYVEDGLNNFYTAVIKNYNIQINIFFNDVDVIVGGTHDKKLTELVNCDINKIDPDELAILNFEFNSLIKMQKEGN